MILTLKLQKGTYNIRVASDYQTLTCKPNGINPDTNEEYKTDAVLGYFGTFQFDLAIARIIQEETYLDGDTIGAKEFLKRFRAMHDNIIAEVNTFKQQLREQQNGN